MQNQKRRRKPPPPPKKKRRKSNPWKPRFPTTFQELEPLRRLKSKQFFENLSQWYRKQSNNVVIADLKASANFDPNAFTVKFNKEFEKREMYDEDIADFVLREKSSAALRWYAELYEYWNSSQ